jgi:hypothetical protein
MRISIADNGITNQEAGGVLRSCFRKPVPLPTQNNAGGGRRKSEVSGGGLQHRKSVFDDLRGIKLMKAP